MKLEDFIVVYLTNGESDAPAADEQRAPAKVLWDLAGEVSE